MSESLLQCSDECAKPANPKSSVVGYGQNPLIPRESQPWDIKEKFKTDKVRIVDQEISH